MDIDCAIERYCIPRDAGYLSQETIFSSQAHKGNTLATPYGNRGPRYCGELAGSPERELYLHPMMLSSPILQITLIFGPYRIRPAASPLAAGWCSFQEQMPCSNPCLPKPNPGKVTAQECIAELCAVSEHPGKGPQSGFSCFIKKKEKKPSNARVILTYFKMVGGKKRRCSHWNRHKANMSSDSGTSIVLFEKRRSRYVNVLMRSMQTAIVHCVPGGRWKSWSQVRCWVC